jgi:glyoxylase-like metal-dependent hydrolase (beta-lactamase superfamily II)
MNEMQAATVSQHYRFTLGNFMCLSISDGELAYPPKNFFSNVPPETVEEALRQRNLPDDHVTTPYTCLFVDTGSHKILVDVGAGSLAPTTGKLFTNLIAAGVEAHDIDTVIITHAHPDHIGGNLDADGKPLYPNARYFIWHAEWTYWNSDAALNKLEAFTKIARKNLEPVHDRLTLLEREQEILPGISAVAAPGHTPGHMALSIVSNGHHLLHISDTVLYPLHLEHPDWLPIYDIQPDKAAASKQRIFDWAVAEEALVFAHHFPPFPNLGYVIHSGKGWRWRSVLGTAG